MGAGFLPEGAMHRTMMILRYLPGACFNRFCVNSRATMFCTDLRTTDMRDEPELAQRVLSVDPSLG